MQSITFSRSQLGFLEERFAGKRYRQMSVHQDSGGDSISYFCPPADRRLSEFENCVMMTLADVEALIVESDAVIGDPVTFAGAFNPPYTSKL